VEEEKEGPKHGPALDVVWGKKNQRKTSALGEEGTGGGVRGGEESNARKMRRQARIFLTAQIEREQRRESPILGGQGDGRKTGIVRG